MELAETYYHTSEDKIFKNDLAEEGIHLLMEVFIVGEENTEFTEEKKIHYRPFVATFAGLPEVEPTTAWGYYYKALYLASKDNDAAMSGFSKAIEVDPQLYQAYRNRAILFAWNRQYEEAISDFSKAIEICPQYAKLYVKRGWLYHKTGRFKKALEDANNALETGFDMTEMEDMSERIDYLYFTEKDYIEKRISSDTASAYGLRARTFYDLHRFDESMQDVEQALALEISLESNKSESFHLRGLLYKRKGDFLSAYKDFSDTIRLEPEHSLAYINRSLTSLEFDNLREDALLDMNRFMYLLSPNRFFQTLPSTLFFYSEVQPAPFLMIRVIYNHFGEKFPSVTHPAIDELLLKSRPLMLYQNWLDVFNVSELNPTGYWYSQIIINYYMGDCIKTYFICKHFDGSPIEDSLVELNFLGYYYYLKSAELFREPYIDNQLSIIQKIENRIG